MKTILSLCIVALVFVGCNSKKEKENPSVTTKEVSTPAPEQTRALKNFKVHPISHATMVLTWDNKVIYVDPVGGAEAFKGQPKANVILVTDIHGDHFNAETLTAVTGENTKIIAPQAVWDKMDENLQTKTEILNNGSSVFLKGLKGFIFEAIPMYNLRKEALKFHEKGRGNGYLIHKNNDTVYISGDTEDIPEMRSLKNVDVAFVCMNLPYTMTVESAAGAVNEFKPTQVYPYHYRGTEGLHDVAKFKELVNQASPEVEVIQLDWYPKQ